MTTPSDTESDEEEELLIVNRQPASAPENPVTAVSSTVENGEEGVRQEGDQQTIVDVAPNTTGDSDKGSTDTEQEEDVTAGDSIPAEEPPQPRRSTRARRPPDWFTSGEYVMKQHGTDDRDLPKAPSDRAGRPPDCTTSGKYNAKPSQLPEPEWLQKARYIQGLINDGVTNSDTLTAIISLLSNS